MATKCFEILEFAIEHQLLANCLVCAFNNRYEIPLKLIAHTELPEAEGFFAEVHGGGGSLIDDLIKQFIPVEVCFRTDEARVYFDTLILKKKKHHWLNKQVVFKYPANVQAVEQRNSDREYVPDHIRILARLATDAPSAAMIPDFESRVMDISPGGASLICPTDRSLVTLEPGQLLRIAISFDGRAPICLRAQHRYTQHLSTNSLRVGLQFDPHSMSSQTATAFQQLLGELETLRLTRSFRSALQKRIN
jgi:hypothetical protein